VLGSLSGDGRFAEIQTMHRAQANMLVCSRALINVARALEQRYGTPWFEGSFYGIRATSDALRQLAALLGDDDLRSRTEALIAREEQAAEQALATVARTAARAQSAALYRRGEILVGGLGAAGFGHDRGGNRHAQIHRRG
jgi:nitrogenase molybdenum-cofactor synthesis protein NifE